MNGMNDLYTIHNVQALRRFLHPRKFILLLGNSLCYPKQS